jgi:excisionase family DNA binding protein
MNLAVALSGQVLDHGDVVVAIAPRLLGLEVAASVYGVSADEIARLQDDEGMPVVRFGRRRLVPVAAVDTWLATRITTNTQENRP